MAATVAFALILVRLRTDVSIATVGLILVIPVVVGVAVGGVRAGVVSVVFGFLTFDFAFIRPYYTLTVGAGQNWAVLVVYVVVMLLVAQLVSRLQDARAEAQRRAADARRLLDLTEMLVSEQPQEELLQRVTDSVKAAFGAAGVALLLPDDQGLRLAAVAGDVPVESDLRELRPDSGLPVAIGPIGAGLPALGLRTIALSAAGRPVGILALHGLKPGADPDLLRSFVNHAAFAIERDELREQALRTQVLEGSDQVRRALLGAVSHDLRTPLTTMKVASTALLETEDELDAKSRRELYGLIDTQSDRLSRLVAGLLDMNRYQAGALQVHTAQTAVAALVDEAVAAERHLMPEREIIVDVPADIGDAAADPILIGQVLVNLLDNADRHAPPDTPIVISAIRHRQGTVMISVSDQGPGVPQPEREAVFDSFYRSDSGGRAGLGLWISRAFVEAHGQRIWVEDPGQSGARFSFTLSPA